MSCFLLFFLCSKSSDAPECESGMKPRFCPFCISFSGSHSIFMVIVVVLFLAHFFICSQEEVQSSFLCNVCVLSQFQIGSSTCVLCVYIVKTRFWAPIPDQKLKCFNFINVWISCCLERKKNEKWNQEMWFGCRERYAMVFRYLTLCLLKSCLIEMGKGCW